MEVDDFSSVKKETSWHINPEISAVLVIDMLNDFLVEGGKMFLPGGDHIVPNQKTVIQAARDVGIPCRSSHDTQHADCRSHGGAT
jgi:nicotinamidase-related amidase